MKRYLGSLVCCIGMLANVDYNVAWVYYYGILGIVFAVTEGDLNAKN